VRKSSGSETTFPRDLTEPAEIEAGVLRMAGDVWAWCEKARSFGRTVTVKVKFADFRVITRSRTHPKPVSEQAHLNQVSLDLIRSIFPVQKGIRLVGVTMSNFEEAADRQEGGLPLLRPAMYAANSCAPVLAGTGP
jgi:DNA polymerase-4